VALAGATILVPGLASVATADAGMSGTTSSASVAHSPVRTEADPFTTYDVAVQLTADGRAQVTLTFTQDFGVVPNHGPYLTLPVLQGYDDDYDRRYDTRITSVSSPTGAPAQYEAEVSSGHLVVRIGDPDRTITGPHQYIVNYTVNGWINSADLTGGLDELYWNTIGEDWTQPISNITVRITGPAAPTNVACYVGSGSTEPCGSAMIEGDQAVFTQSHVEPGVPFTTVTGWPAGTFPGVTPLLERRATLSSIFPITPVTVGGFVVIAAVGLVFLVRRLRVVGSDEQYMGLTPGLVPSPFEQAHVGRRIKTPVAVQFTPPAGFRVGELGTLLDEQADMNDITATIIDLAVRGYLRIEQTRQGGFMRKAKYRLVRLGNPDPSWAHYERIIFDTLFERGPVVDLDDLEGKFSTMADRVRDSLYREVTRQGWFRTNPETARRRWGGQGLLILIAGLALAYVGFRYGPGISLAWWGAGVVVVGVAWMAVAKSAPARTAKGTAILIQLEGFRTYMATAEANQIRFEENTDVFSKYLPYAVVFGLTERWAAVFAQLAAAGAYLYQPVWFYGPNPMYMYSHPAAFASDMSSFADQITSTMEKTLTSGSSGLSGFSGGFGGGGVGGGGGGSW
jgi:hypothetical protein